MRLLPAFLARATAFAFLALVHASAADSRFYVAASAGKAEGIYTDTLDPDTGKLGTLELAAPAGGPGFLAASRDGRFLYATTRSSAGKVSAYATSPGGKLNALNDQSSGINGPCHVWVDATGRDVFVASYGGGSIACFAAKPDGSLGDRSAFVQYTGSGPDPKRQKKPFAHSIYTDPSNRFVYSCDLGTDNIWIFKFDAATGALTPAEPPSAKVPPGSGPRHLAFDTDGTHVFVANEMGLSVTVFARDLATGALTPIQTAPALPENIPAAGATTAEISCHPSGKWLYVSTRGPDVLTVFAIAPGGKLDRIQVAPAEVKVPRGFAIDPTGRWLIAAGQNDGRIAVLKIDPATGMLSPTDQAANASSPICILFAPGDPR